MGKLDSSLTRVQPVFDELLTRDPYTWLPDLLQLPHRTGPRHPLPTDPGALIPDHDPYEYPAPPSREYLTCLLKNPADHVRRPADTYWDKLSKSTRAKREKLFKQDTATLNEALAALDNWPALPQKAWWLLEGRSMIDCALITDRMLLFVEGKRTEAGPSAGTIWAPARNQVLRNLDCARALAACKGLPHYFAMLVVEDYGDSAADLRRAKQHQQVTDPDVVAKSLPHMDAHEREEALRHYLGVTTWQAIVARFGLKPLI
ncbi:MAG: hypothetical protein K0R39_324 [Symbiobacteriaceae bacterium]|jgi:hypothetical protein|nr:hypothetical protein [Symbiobacteriaceae bacterium]